jgi:ribosomal protein S18 acetylase RimI-like enzyme
MPRHLLDNPVWYALTGPHAALAVGCGAARHYPRDVAPFSAVEFPTPAAYADLAADLPPGIEARLFRPTDEPVPPGWQSLSARPLIQVVLDDVSLLDAPSAPAFTALGAADVAAMMELVELAEPGPFGPRTYLLGGYAGLWRGGNLVAMGGERLRLPGFVELSAIAVHPAARCAGLGATVATYLARRALAGGETPFLHVFPDNPAIALYLRLGFRERARLWVLWRRVAPESGR